MFQYTKELLFTEFDIEKKKDEKKSTSKKECYENRINFFKDHIKNKEENPKCYEHLDIKFDKLLSVYQSVNPKDTFYKIVFGKSYNEYWTDYNKLYE
tara:strand:- start:714 stop:1004 length:291 start_codon:yes stop_codon:yes gene_type:complete